MFFHLHLFLYMSSSCIRCVCVPFTRQVMNFYDDKVTCKSSYKMEISYERTPSSFRIDCFFRKKVLLAQFSNIFLHKEDFTVWINEFKIGFVRKFSYKKVRAIKFICKQTKLRANESVGICKELLRWSKSYSTRFFNSFQPSSLSILKRVKYSFNEAWKRSTCVIKRKFTFERFLWLSFPSWFANLLLLYLRMTFKMKTGKISSGD